MRKKKTPTTTTRADYAKPGIAPSGDSGAKVFCFFSSEKKALFAFKPHPSRRMVASPLHPANFPVHARILQAQ